LPSSEGRSQENFGQALTGIQFEPGNDVIRPTSFPILNNVVTVMKDFPEYMFEMNGHSDHESDDAANLDLSQGRANAVKKNLTDKSFEAACMTVKGYSEIMPVEDNASPAGRTKNCRV